MNAVVLAGGFATRLRPLSCTRPKLLFPIGNKPLLDWTLERLAKSHVKKVILAVNYMADTLIQHYGKSKHEMKLFYSKEERPLGTGGAIKNAEKLIGDQKPFLVLNGDIFTNFDYTKLLEKHKKNDAIATIALYHVEDPSRYGTVKLAEKNRVAQFVEKPTSGEAPSNLVNAGMYILDPQIFDYIPSGQTISIERETFPKLADENKIYGHHFEDLWIDIGEPRDYLKVNQLLLDSKTKKNQIGKNSFVKSDVEIKDPTIIDEKVTIGKKSKIGPHVTIGKHVIIKEKAHIENSVILPQTTISDSTSIEGTIVGEGVIIGSNVKIKEGCIIGDHAVIQDNVTLTQGVTICPFRKVSENVLTPKCLM